MLEKLFIYLQLIISYCNIVLILPIETCSSRSTPKPRLPSPTSRPNITFKTYACPEAYAKWYCLNGAICFSVKIGESILYNCECAPGYMGQRCEFKDLDGSYLEPASKKINIETASVQGCSVFTVVLVVLICIFRHKFTKMNIVSRNHQDKHFDNHSRNHPSSNHLKNYSSNHSNNHPKYRPTVTT